MLKGVRKKRLYLLYLPARLSCWKKLLFFPLCFRSLLFTASLFIAPSFDVKIKKDFFPLRPTGWQRTSSGGTKYFIQVVSFSFGKKKPQVFHPPLQKAPFGTESFYVGTVFSHSQVCQGERVFSLAHTKCIVWDESASASASSVLLRCPPPPFFWRAKNKNECETLM